MTLLEPLPNTVAAVSFLKLVYPDGPWVLTAIRTDRKAIDTKTFRPSTEADLLAWLNAYNGERNIYWSTNPPVRDLTKKAEREDIKEVAYLHVDIDPRAGEDLDEERKRCLALFTEKLPASVPPPTVLLFSGGGYQAFWKLEAPIPINGDLTLAEDAKRYNQQLELLFGGDNCHNIDRIMRLPGTVNVPDAKKIKKGRSPTLATLVDFFADRVYPLSKFTQSPLARQQSTFGQKAVVVPRGDVKRLADVSELDRYDVPDRVKAILCQGNHPDQPKEGDGSRSIWLFDAVCQLVRCNVPDNLIYAIITDPDLGISESVIDKGSPNKIDYYANRQIERAKLAVADPDIFEMNQRHATISLAGQFRGVTFKPDLMFPTQMVAEFSKKDDFCNIYLTPYVTKTINNRIVEIGRGKYFLSHPQREQYDDVQFLPGGPKVIEVEDNTGKIARYLNLYSGFAFEPKEGDCQLYLDHVRDNICDADNAVYNYVLNLMAQIVQHPDDPPRVALSLRSPEEGTGKGIFVTEFGSIFGRHFWHIQRPEHLIGKFNAHSAEALFEYADEADLSNPRNADLLKTHLSERTKMIERKGIDAYKAPNYASTWFASNMVQPVMIQEGSRRIFPLRVNPRHAMNKGYFLPLLEQMRNGGREALLHFLLQRDVTGFNAEKMPQTEELKTQKALGVSEKDALVISWAQVGHLPGALQGSGGNSKPRPFIAASRELLKAMRETGGWELAQMSDYKLTEILKTEWGFTSHPLNTGGGWRAPELAQLRAAILRKHPGTVWNHPEIVAWGGQMTAKPERGQRSAVQSEVNRQAQGVLGQDVEAPEEVPF